MHQPDRVPSRARLRSISRTKEEEEEGKRVCWSWPLLAKVSTNTFERMLENTGFYEHGFREAIASDTPAALIKDRRGDTFRISKEKVVVRNIWD